MGNTLLLAVGRWLLLFFPSLICFMLGSGSLLSLGVRDYYFLYHFVVWLHLAFGANIFSVEPWYVIALPTKIRDSNATYAQESKIRNGDAEAELCLLIPTSISTCRPPFHPYPRITALLIELLALNLWPFTEATVYLQCPLAR